MVLEIRTDRAAYEVHKGAIRSVLARPDGGMLRSTAFELDLDQVREIADAIHTRLNRGATFLEGRGTYTGKYKQVILTVVNNYQLKRLEEAVFHHDPDAFVITENTFNVYGKGFSRRKVY